MFACASCRHKDEEIAFLRAQNKTLTEKLFEVAVPGITHRVAVAGQQKKREERESPLQAQAIMPTL